MWEEEVGLPKPGYAGYEGGGTDQKVIKRENLGDADELKAKWVRTLNNHAQNRRYCKDSV